MNLLCENTKLEKIIIEEQEIIVNLSILQINIAVTKCQYQGFLFARHFVWFYSSLFLKTNFLIAGKLLMFTSVNKRNDLSI